MADIQKGYTFTNGETVTPAKLHALVDDATVADGSITTAKLANSLVTTAKIADANVTTAKIADSAVTSAKIADGTIVNADISASAAIALSKLATGALPTGITIASANIEDGTIVNADISNSAAIALSKLATGALPTGITIASANIVDGTIVNADIADSAITSAKIADGTIVNADISNSAAIADTKLATISTAGKVANSATTATNANTANAIVARDASGNFSAGTINATQIQINSESSPLHILQTSSNSATGSEIQFRKTRGTLSSEQATLNSDVLGECSYYARSATGLNQAAAIRVRQIANTTQNALAQIEFAMRQNNDGFSNVITFTNIGGATFNGIVNAQNFATTSDKTLKENIDYSIANSLQKVKQLKPAKFDFIQGDKNQFGFIAQDVLEVIPDLVVKNTNDKFGIKMMDLIPHLVSCIQELAARVEALEAAQP